MKTILKNVLCSALFVTILLGLLTVASHIVQPKGNAPTDGIKDYPANGVLGEREGTIDVLILGDSETYSAFIPLKIWRDFGITSYVCGTSGQKLCYSEEFLYKAFKKQNPRLVILETDAIFRPFSWTDVITQKAGENLPVMRYHNRWKSLQPKDWSPAVNYTHVEDNKGYVYFDIVKAASTDGYMAMTTAKEAIPKKNEGYVEQIAKFCESNNARFVLVSTPSTKNWNMKRHNSIAELAHRLNAEYIDMNLMPEQIPMDWKQDSRDYGDHLNYYGAVKVSAYLGKYLSDSGIFQDKRLWKDYQSWNRAAEQFYQSIQNGTA